MRPWALVLDPPPPVSLDRGPLQPSGEGQDKHPGSFHWGGGSAYYCAQVALRHRAHRALGPSHPSPWMPRKVKAVMPRRHSWSLFCGPSRPPPAPLEDRGVRRCRDRLILRGWSRGLWYARALWALSEAKGLATLPRGWGFFHRPSDVKGCGKPLQQVFLWNEERISREHAAPLRRPAQRPCAIPRCAPVQPCPPPPP